MYILLTLGNGFDLRSNKLLSLLFPYHHIEVNMINTSFYTLQPSDRSIHYCSVETLIRKYTESSHEKIREG